MGKAPMYLPAGYKKRRRLVSEAGRASTGQVSKKGTTEQWEHWDGSMDAVAKPAAIGLSLKPTNGAPPVRAHVEAIHELEQAMRELRMADASKDQLWQARARKRYADAVERVEETQ